MIASQPQLAPRIFPQPAALGELPAPAADAPDLAIEYVLPLSGCRLRVFDLPDGSRVGQLFSAAGRLLDEARCEARARVTGWFGRSGADGSTWALALGAGGSHEMLNVRFANLRARRSVPVSGDQYGLWVAEVSGAFRAATVQSDTSATTVRLHYAA